MFLGVCVVMVALSVKNLGVSVEKKIILHGINLDIKEGQVYALFGPNGSGKSSLAYTIMGHPAYQVQNGQIVCFGTVVNDLSPDKRAKLGLFLAMQQPYEIEGVPLKDFLRQAYNVLYDGTSQQLTLKQFNNHLNDKLALLDMDFDYITRPINVGFSGGEKKRAEMLQLAVLQPKIVLLDEIDSGLDVDALKVVLKALNTIKNEQSSMAILMITHNPRLFDFFVPYKVHVMQEGKIIASGGKELIEDIEQYGFK